MTKGTTIVAKLICYTITSDGKLSTNPLWTQQLQTVLPTDRKGNLYVGSPAIETKGDGTKNVYVAGGRTNTDGWVFRVRLSSTFGILSTSQLSLATPTGPGGTPVACSPNIGTDGTVYVTTSTNDITGGTNSLGVCAFTPNTADGGMTIKWKYVPKVNQRITTSIPTQFRQYLNSEITSVSPPFTASLGMPSLYEDALGKTHIITNGTNKSAGYPPSPGVLGLDDYPNKYGVGLKLQSGASAATKEWDGWYEDILPGPNGSTAPDAIVSYGLTSQPLSTGNDIYFGTTYYTHPFVEYLYNQIEARSVATGQRLWTQTIHGSLQEVPAVDSGNNVIVTGYEGTSPNVYQAVYKYNSTGVFQWKYLLPLGRLMGVAPSIDSYDNIVFPVTSGDGSIQSNNYVLTIKSDGSAVYTVTNVSGINSQVALFRLNGSSFGVLGTSNGIAVIH